MGAKRACARVCIIDNANRVALCCKQNCRIASNAYRRLNTRKRSVMTNDS